MRRTSIEYEKKGKFRVNMDKIMVVVGLEIKRANEANFEQGYGAAWQQGRFSNVDIKTQSWSPEILQELFRSF